MEGGPFWYAMAENKLPTTITIPSTPIANHPLVSSCVQLPNKKGFDFIRRSPGVQIVITSVATSPCYRL